MGQKRTQNIIDKQIGAYLANFEKQLLGKVQRLCTGRLDQLIEQEDRLARSADNMNREIERTRNLVEGANRFAERLDFRIQTSYFIFALLGGVTGAGFFYLLLVWIG